MGKQIIISISREYGSCGHEIAELVAKELGIHLYDRNLLDAVAKEKNISAEELRKYDEKPKNPFISLTASGKSIAQLISPPISTISSSPTLLCQSIAILGKYPTHFPPKTSIGLLPSPLICRSLIA